MNLSKRIVPVSPSFSVAGTLVTHEKAICITKIRGAISKRIESVCLAVGVCCLTLGVWGGLRGNGDGWWAIRDSSRTSV